MEIFTDDDEYWKCQKHPSQSRNGVCPICLKNRLNLLCPHCANVRPCLCCVPSSSSSSSSSSSLSSVEKYGTGVGSVGRISILIDSEPAFKPTFKRSRSAALPFLRQNPGEKVAGIRQPEYHRSKSTSFFLSLFKAEKTKKKVDVGKNMTTKLPRSRSVGFVCYSDPGEISGGEVRLKGKGWSFPSPSKVFRLPKFVHERSPMRRG
ncbi:uncharacterized protein LOC143876901 [Tasmannia lanceolata]|uniref:uncharacterized protein LOC143876901 n=1 Tax=Tasmannia lanceolata TaxID=3420 RepID=UPI00406313CB